MKLQSQYGGYCYSDSLKEGYVMLFSLVSCEGRFYNLDNRNKKTDVAMDIKFNLFNY